jgi:indolepyruvate ferredoxin oxidoreductase
VGQVRLVSDDPARWRDLPGGAMVGHRDEMDAIQREMREIPGVTAIVYEQTCAAEKRRRRKRGAFPDPDRRLFINPRVCEGCGDCSVQSNCIAVQPLVTPYGVKRRIDQSACNKDFSCVKGFCPSFVEIDGPVLPKPEPDRIQAMEAERFPNLPHPAIMPLTGPWNIYVAGIGGLGVLTVGALLGTAAHLEGLEASVLDFTGLAQKNGAVVSQVRIAPAGCAIHAARIGPGEADLILGTDSVVASSADAQTKLASGRGAVVRNTDETPTADILTDRDATLPTARMIDTLLGLASKRGFILSATRLAEGLFGNNVAANTLMVGYAWQKGLLPLSAEAFEAAIEANGMAVALNRRAFAWGRLAAVDPDAAEAIAGIGQVEMEKDRDADGRIGDYAADLTAYQNAVYAARYTNLMRQVQTAASAFGAAGAALVDAVATNAYRVMAYKDEYEVARLYSEPAFRQSLNAQFAGMKRVSVYLAPTLLSRIDPATGRPAKRKFGPWIFKAMALLAKGKRVRDRWADPFRRTAERRAERALRDNYLATIVDLLPRLDVRSFDTILVIARLPDMVRGYGPVKEEAMTGYYAKLTALLDQLNSASRLKAA